MKRIVVCSTVLAVMLGAAALPVGAAEDTAAVFVTVVDGEGTPQLAQQALSVRDCDGDGALTVHDALYAAHEAAYTGGAAAGYGTSTTEYGLGITKLWGTENGSAYGYYVNNIACMALTDPIKDGDYVNAFVYRDPDTLSDTYCYFDQNTVTADAGEAITLTLLAIGYDENWNTVVNPIADATVQVDFVDADYTTDAEGKVTLSIADGGDHIISASSKTMHLVAPICKAAITVDGQPVVTTTQQTEAATTTSATTTTTVVETTPASTAATSGVAVPDTGEQGAAGLLMLGVVSTAAAAFAMRKRAEK